MKRVRQGVALGPGVTDGRGVAVRRGVADGRGVAEGSGVRVGVPAGGVAVAAGWVGAGVGGVKACRSRVRFQRSSEPMPVTASQVGAAL